VIDGDPEKGFIPEDDPARAAPVRYWPPRSPPPVDNRIRARCPACSLLWWVHGDLAGFRLRCDCGAWADVPLAKRDEGLGPAGPALPSPELERDALSKAETGSVEEHASREIVLRDEGLATGLALEPGSLREASVRTRQKWTDRSILELAAMMGAFWIPSLLLMFLAEGRTQALLMPLASLGGGILVLGIGLAAGSTMFVLLRRTAGRFYLEAGILAFVAAFVALGWTHLLTEAGMSDGESWFDALKEELGIPWMLFLVGLCPALFEELAFRGLFQGRVAALLGEKLGILVTGAAFATAHGITAGFLFHAFLGVYLCWLRVRSASLYPGMVNHFLYNSTLVVLA
jgi:membrane protease YdiL (CAAX protease family)